MSNEPETYIKLRATLTSAQLPSTHTNVIVDGGVAYWDGHHWYSTFTGAKLQWSVKWWAHFPWHPRVIIDPPPVDPSKMYPEVSE